MDIKSGDNVFRRHDNCNCTVESICDKTVTNVHNKKSYQLSESEVRAFEEQNLKSLTNTRIDDIIEREKQIETLNEKARDYINNRLETANIEYNEVKLRKEKLSESEIIDMISGGDKTEGSCASVALAYAGQKQGYDVLDFRGGDSMIFFSNKINKVKMFDAVGAKTIEVNSAKTSLTNGKRIIQQLEEGKEYYLSVGRHAAIVRINSGIPQYLELQSPIRNGWKNFGDVGAKLKSRFGCSPSSKYFSAAYATDISQLGNDEFETILGYINTSSYEQAKGATGYVK